MEHIKLNQNDVVQIKLITDHAVNILESGGVIIYPTDTLYGLGANALDENAIIKVFKIKKRDKNKPISVLAKDIKMARKISCIDYKVEKILSEIWPGPITVILRKKDIIPYVLTGNTETIGIRIPNNKFVSTLMEKIDFPITATSANISGESNLLNPEKIIKGFSKREVAPDLFIDIGKISNPEPSTILDFTTNTPKIVRMGIVGKDKIKDFFDKFGKYQEGK